MKYFCLFYLTITFFSIHSCFSQYDVEGKIKDSNTGLPIEGAHIKYILDDRIMDLEIFSDQNGEFFLRNYPVNETDNAIELIIKKEGYQSQILLKKMKDRILDDIYLISDSKTINGKIKFVDDKNAIPGTNIKISYLDKLNNLKTVYSDELGNYQITTFRKSGEELDLTFFPPPKIKGLPYSLVIPRGQNFKDIQIVIPRKSNNLILGFSIATVLGTALLISSKYISEKNYKSYLQETSVERQKYYRTANKWNKLAILGTGLAVISGVGLTITFGNQRKRNHTKIYPEIF